MIKKFVSSFIFLMLTSGYVAADSCPGPAPDQALSTKLALGAIDFSFNLYKKLNATNLFFSPFSVRTALAMTAVGAVGTTLTQMGTALVLDGLTQAQINQAFQEYLASFCPNNNYTLSTANRIYVQKGFPIYPTFTEALKTYFMSDAQTEDFGTNPSGAATEINKWVANQTNDNIKNLFSENSFSAATVLVLVNAIYFKGTWQVKFDSALTKDGPFTLANGTTIEVPIMHVTSKFKYCDSQYLHSQVVQLNYAGNELAMHIILPEEGVPFAYVRERVNSKIINDVINKYVSKKVIVSLPKFKANFKQELNVPLKALGMVDVFSQNAANLSGIASTANRELFVSSVIHQAVVAVDEEGTVAAAATGVSVSITSESVNQPDLPIPFDVSRPCIYLICDLRTNQCLFMGNLDNPKG